MIIVLILSRQCSESIHLGEHIVLTIVSISGDKVRIGVEAPPGMRILRKELGKKDEVAYEIAIPLPQADSRKAA